MQNLNRLRQEIDTIDKDLLRLIKKRVGVVQKIGELKTELSSPVKDPERERLVIEKLVKETEDSELSAEAIEKIWRTIFDVSYKVER